MHWKRKICLGALLCGIVFLMLATHNIQKNGLLPVAIVGIHSLTATITARALAQPPTATPGGPRGVACGCPSCVADGGRSEWFDKRYEPLQQPFLTAQNSSLPPLTRKWWMGIQHSPQEPTLEEVMQNMFKLVSSPQPDWLPQQNRCRRCAVVGNSGNLLGSKFGALIDSHTSVIRMNKARTSGFETDVGNRTTHHIIYPESAVDMQPGVTLVLLPFKVRDLQWLISALTTGEIKTTYMRVKDRVRADKDKIMVVHPALFKYTYDKWTEHHGKYPSTGMLAIIFSLHICDQVSVFGYGADEKGNWHHYWENNGNAGAFRKTGVHNADFEMEVILKLAADGKIQLHKR